MVDLLDNTSQKRTLLNVRDFLRSAFTRQNIFKFFWILFIISVIPVGVYLVQKTQIFKSRAGGEKSVVFFGEGVSEEGGQYIATQLEGIKIRLTSPLVKPVPTGPVPASPADISVSCSSAGTSAGFNWDTVADVNRYDLYLHKSADPWSWSTACDAPHTCQRLNVANYSSSIVPEVAYILNLAACNDSGCSIAAQKTFTCNGIPTPDITNGGVNTAYQPWVVWLIATHTAADTVIQLWDGNNRWGGDLPFTKATDYEGGSFELPANIPPSECNIGKECIISVKIYNKNTQLSSNSFAFKLPAVDPSTLPKNLLSADMQNVVLTSGQKVKWFESAEALGVFKISGNAKDGLIAVDEYGPVKDAQGNRDYIKSYLNNSTFTVSSYGHAFVVILRSQTSAPANFSRVTLNKIADVAVVTPPPNAPKANITNGGVNAAFQPWVVWLQGENLNSNLVVQLFDNGNRWGEYISVSLAGDRTWLSFQLPSNSPPSDCNRDGSCEITVKLLDKLSRLSSDAYKLNLPQNNVQGIAKVAERPYTTHFKVAKSQEGLQNAALQVYDEEFETIDYRFESNIQPQSPETLFVQFIRQEEDRVITSEIRQMTIIYKPVIAPTSAGTPPKDFSNIKSTTFYTFPHGFGMENHKLVNEFREAVSGIKAAGFNTVWFTPNRVQFEPTPGQYNQEAFNDLREVLSILKQNGLKAILPLSYGDNYYQAYCAYKGNYYPELVAYQTEFLRRIQDYNNIVYISVFTEHMVDRCGDYQSGEMGELARSTIGNFPRQLPSDLRSKFTIGIHDSGLAEGWYGGTSPINDNGDPNQNPFDFISAVFYFDMITVTKNGQTNPIYFIDKRSRNDEDPPSDSVVQDVMKSKIDSRVNNVKNHYPNTPLMFGETGAYYCQEFGRSWRDSLHYTSPGLNNYTLLTDANKLTNMQAVILGALEEYMTVNKNLGVNVWHWKPIPAVEGTDDCKFGGHSITYPDGSLKPAGQAVKNLFTQIQTPVISRADLNTAYDPWVTWFIASHTNANTVVQFFDQGTKWGSDIPLTLDDKGTGGTVQLPSNSPPSVCNKNGSCQITVKLFDRQTGALSNEYALTLPQAPVQSPIQDIINTIENAIGGLLNSPVPVPAVIPTPVPVATPTPIESGPTPVPTPIPTPIPTPAPGPIQTIVEVIIKPLENIISNIPVLSQLVAAPTPIPTPIPIPSVSDASLNTSGNPWTVTVSASNINYDTRVKLFDQGKQWESDMLLVLSDDKKGGTFTLPSNTPPSGCNQKASCPITFKLYDKNTGALSNESSLTLPVNTASQKIEPTPIPTPVPLPTTIPTPIPAPAGPVQTIVESVRNIVSNIPIISRLIPTPTPIPTPIPIPSVSDASLNTSGNPWTVTVSASNINYDTRVKLFDQGKQWESDMLLVLSDDKKGGTFTLPSNTPPSGCNQKASCPITFKLYDKNTGALSNESSLTLPVNTASQKIEPTPIPTPVPLPTTIPTPIPTPAPGPIQTVAEAIAEPIQNIIANIPIISSLISSPAPEPTTSPLPIPQDSVIPEVTAAQADFNSDSKVNAVDLSILFSSWGKKEDQMKNKKPDLNSDNIINSIDYTLFLKSYKR